MKCQNCQFDIQESAKSCPFCNFTVGDAAPDAPPSDAPAGTAEGSAQNPPEQDPPEQYPQQAPGDPQAEAPQIQDLSDENAIPDVMPAGPPPPVPEPQPIPQSGPEPSDDGFEIPVIPKRSILKIIGPLAAACVMGYAGYLFYVPKPAPPPPEPPPAEAAPAAAPQDASAPAQPAPVDPADPGAQHGAQPAAQPGTRSSDPLMVDPRMAAMMESQKPPEETPEAGADTDGQKPARPAVKEGDVWVFEGTVRDLISFKPVRGAQMLFVSIRNENDFNTTTNARGLYRISLPGDEQGYRLMVDHPDYLADYFEEVAGKSFRNMAKGNRFQLRSAKPAHSAWIGAGAQAAQRDIYLFPDITD